MIYKKSWKYILIKNDNYLYRIKSLKNFYNVRKGEIGGYIGGYHNLSQKGNCWIYNDAQVFSNAQVYENTSVFGYVQIYGDAQVFGNAIVSKNAKVY